MPAVIKRDLPPRFSFLTDNNRVVDVDRTVSDARLGSGQSSVVYRGMLIDPSDQEARTVAVICPHAGEACEEHVANDVRYTQLVEDAAAGRHTGIPRILDTCLRPDTKQRLGAFVIKERMAGESLDTHIKLGRIARRTGQLVLSRLLQTAITFEEARVVHLDVKPGNVQFDLTTHATWLHDLGYARTEKAPNPTPGFVCGSPIFMAPEMCRYNGIIDRRTPIFPFGLILLECVTNGAYSETRTLKKMTRDQPLTISDLLYETATGGYRRYINQAMDAYNSGHTDNPLPNDLQAVIVKATQLDPDLRYQDAQAMCDDMVVRGLVLEYDHASASIA